MIRILLVETASPKRVSRKLEQILQGEASQRPEISVLCREDHREAFSRVPGVAVYSFAGARENRLPKAILEKKFDALYLFWTGEKRYRRAKLLALRLEARTRHVVAGDGNEFRLTWKSICRHALFRRKHPLPTDHWDFVMPPKQPEPQAPSPGIKSEPAFPGERILILQTAEPPYVLKALERLDRARLFQDPQYTLFCRNRPEAVDGFRGHPLLSHIRIHSEANDSGKHLLELRRSGFDGLILFLTGDPSYWKLKIFAFLLGIPLNRTLIFNESMDCFFFNWSQWLGLILHRMQSRPTPAAGSKWTHSARILVSLLLKSVMLPFRFFWLLLVWLRLRCAGLRASRKDHDDSPRLPILPGV